VRRALVSVAVASVGAAGVAASAWAVQAAALPPPKPAARVAADASVWFHEHRLAVDVFHFDHRRVKGACVRGWQHPRNGGKIRASLLSFRTGPILRVWGKQNVSVVVAGQRRSPPGLLAADAGCSRMLERTLAAAAQGAGHLTMEPAYAANRPVIELELQLGREERLRLFVAPETEQPLVAFVDLDAQKITARIYLQRVRPEVLAHFRLLHRIEPVPQS
jgi:hypothetical protein